MVNNSFSFAELEIFRAVAECGGITRAAARLHRVQSNITTRLQQLEERLGLRLFHRRKRRLVLSAEGELLLSYADRLLRLAAEAEGAVRNGAPRGVLRIGALESTAATRLPPLLSRYHRAYPDVRMEMVTGTSGALVDRVTGGELEAAFVAEPFNAAGLRTQHAFTEELVLIGAKGFNAKSPQGAVLSFSSGCSYRRRLETWLGRSGISPQRVMEFGSYHAIVACAAAGSGIAIVPRSVLGTMPAGIEVDCHALPREIAHAKTQLVWREGHQSAALDALKEEIATCAKTAAPARPGAATPAYRSASRRPGAARRAPRSSAPAASR